MATAEELGYVTRTSNSNPDRLSIDLEFHKGLYEDNNGYLKARSVELDIEYRELPIGHWIAFDPFVADGTGVKDDPFRLAALDISGISEVYAHVGRMALAFDDLNTRLAAMAGGDKAAPEEFLPRVAYRLGKLSARLEALEAHATGTYLVKVQALQSGVDAVKTQFDTWGTTESPVTEARNNANWAMDYYEASIGLTESLLYWKARDIPENYITPSRVVRVAESPWWKRWCLAYWYRQSVENWIGIPSGKPRYHTFTEKQKGFMRKSASWYVDSDAAITGGSNQYDVRLRRRSQEEQDDDKASSIYDEMQWATYRTHRAKDAVNLGLLRQHNCPVSIVAMRVKSSDQLSGMVNNFNCIAEAVLPVAPGYEGDS